MHNIVTSEFIYRHYNAIFRNICFFVNRIEFFGGAKNTRILSFGCINGEHDSSAARLVIYSLFQKIDQLIKAYYLCKGNKFDGIYFCIVPGQYIILRRTVFVRNRRPSPDTIETVFRRTVLIEDFVSICKVRWKIFISVENIIVPAIIQISMSYKPFLTFIIRNHTAQRNNLICIVGRQNRSICIIKLCKIIYVIARKGARSSL